MKDYRISRATIEGMDDEDILWAVIEPFWDDLSLDQEPETGRTSGLTPGQRGLVAVDWLSKEIYNGGIDQFFRNSTGVLAQEAMDGFRMMSAERYAELLAPVFALFPGGRVPKDHVQRLAAMQAMPEDARRKTFAEFDEAFYALMDGDDPIVPYGIRYVNAHPGEFFRDGA